MFGSYGMSSEQLLPTSPGFTPMVIHNQTPVNAPRVYSAPAEGYYGYDPRAQAQFYASTTPPFYSPPVHSGLGNSGGYTPVTPVFSPNIGGMGLVSPQIMTPIPVQFQSTSPGNFNQGVVYMHDRDGYEAMDHGNYDLANHMSELDLGQNMPKPANFTNGRRRSSGNLTRRPSVTLLDVMNDPHEVNLTSSETHLVASALDRRQSLKLQKRIARAKANEDLEELESMFYQFLPEILRLSRDQYANFVLQRLIENLSVDLVDSIADKVKKDTLIMATNQYACRVLQSVLNRCSPKSRDELVNNLLPDAGELLQDNFGCYVLQKIIETVHSSQLGELMNEHIIPRYFDLSVHQYSCRVMQDVFRYFDSQNKIQITESVLQKRLALCQDGYGNYVVQKMIHYGDEALRAKVCDALLPYVVQLCCNKAGSNILEKCLSKASDLRKVELMKPIIENQQDLGRIVGDKFGNYVIQRMLVSLPYQERQVLINSLKSYFTERNLTNLNDYENYVYQQIMKKSIPNKYAKMKTKG
jgi:hypothetical protein